MNSHLILIAIYLNNSRSQLRRHKSTVHSSALPFACADCDFRTKRRDKLKGHRDRMHKGSKVKEQRNREVEASSSSVYLEYLKPAAAVAKQEQ